MSSTSSNWVLNLIDNITSPLRNIAGASNQAGESLGGIPDKISDIDDAGEKMANNAGKKLPSAFEEIGASLLVFNQAAQAIGRLRSEMQNAIAPGITYQTAIANLQTTGHVTAEQLSSISDRARAAGRAFGVDMTRPVEVSTMLLSQLSPELANNSDAMDLMVRNALTLSKTMNGDTRAATEALIVSMRQYGVSLDDPMRAGQAMTEMMNIMAESSRLGSSSLSEIKDALRISGVAAKAANVHFAEANAAIQVLSDSGRKGSEAGNSLRHVMGILSKERFLMPGVQEELAAAGIDVNDLSDKSKSLADRLKPLRGIMHDTALVAKLFGAGNYQAALAMIEGIDQMEQYTEAVQGTNSAQEQASIIMGTYAEKQSRIATWFDNIKISIFNTTKSFMPFAEVTGSVIEKSASLAMAVKGLSIVMDTKLGSAIKGSISWIGRLGKSLLVGTKTTIAFSVASVSSFAAFKIAAVSACKAVSAAIMSIPIVGWVAAAIAALIALGAYFYNTSETFRGFLWGMWDAVKTVFTGIWGFIKEVMEGIWHLIKGVFNPANWFNDDYKFADGLKKITDAAANYGEKIGKSFAEGKEKGIEDFRTKKVAKEDDESIIKNPSSGLLDIKAVTGGDMDFGMMTPGVKTGAGTNDNEQGLRLAGSGGGGGGKSITMNITQNNHFSGSQNQEDIAEAIFRKLNDRFRDTLLAAG